MKLGVLQRFASELLRSAYSADLRDCGTQVVARHSRGLVSDRALKRWGVLFEVLAEGCEGWRMFVFTNALCASGKGPPSTMAAAIDRVLQQCPRTEDPELLSRPG